MPHIDGRPHATPTIEELIQREMQGAPTPTPMAPIAGVDDLEGLIQQEMQGGPGPTPDPTAQPVRPAAPQPTEVPLGDGPSVLGEIAQRLPPLRDFIPGPGFVESLRDVVTPADPNTILAQTPEGQFLETGLDVLDLLSRPFEGAAETIFRGVTGIPQDIRAVFGQGEAREPLSPFETIKRFRERPTLEQIGVGLIDPTLGVGRLPTAAKTVIGAVPPPSAVPRRPGVIERGARPPLPDILPGLPDEVAVPPVRSPQVEAPPAAAPDPVLEEIIQREMASPSKQIIEGPDDLALREQAGQIGASGGEGISKKVLKDQPVFRIDVPDADLTPSKRPQGLYVSIGDAVGASPHTDVGEVVSKFAISPKKLLDVPGDLQIQHPRFGRWGRGPVSAGISALKQLTPPAEFERLRAMRKPELIDELNAKFPGPDYTRFEDSYELLETYGAQLARQQGHDAIRQIDDVLPEFSEIVVLNDAALSSAEQIGEEGAIGAARAAELAAAPLSEAVDSGLQGILGRFRGILNDPSRAQDWERTLLARRTERGVRAGSMQERVSDLVSAGVPVEEAIKRGTKELSGELPAAASPFEELATPYVREALFQEVFAQLADEPLEMAATATALKRALDTGSIPRTPGAKGGSSFTLLQRVFGDQLTETLGQGRSLDEVINNRLGTPPRGLSEPSEVLPDPTMTFGGVETARLLPEEAALSPPQQLLQTEAPMPAFERAPVNEAESKARSLYLRALSRAEKVARDVRHLRHLVNRPTPRGVSGGADIPPGGGGQAALIPDSEQPALRKVNWQTARDIVGLPRALLTTGEFSAYLRQGGVLARGHPVTAVKDMGKALPSMFSEKGFQQGMLEMRQRPEFERFVTQGKLFFAEDVGAFNKGEEVFANRIAQKIPLLGRLIRGSERNFVHFLNRLRMDVMSDVVHGWEKSGLKATQKELDDLADFINHATGRGDLGKLAVISQELNATFFAPRLAVSRFQLLWDALKVVDPRRPAARTQFGGDIPTPLAPGEALPEGAALDVPQQLITPEPGGGGASLRVRKVIAKDLAAFVGTNMMLLAFLEALPGVSVGADPRSSEFGKVRIGNTRWDFWTGFAQIARYGVQAYKGEKVQANGKIRVVPIPITIERYIRSKLSPPGALVRDVAPVARGDAPTDFLGRPISLDPKSLGIQAANRMIPLFYQDVVDAFREEGLGGLALVIPAIAGVGVTTYPPSDPERQRSRAEKEGFQRKIWEVFPATEEEIKKFERKMDREFGRGSGSFRRQLLPGIGAN